MYDYFPLFSYLCVRLLINLNLLYTYFADFVVDIVAVGEGRAAAAVLMTGVVIVDLYVVIKTF